MVSEKGKGNPGTAQREETVGQKNLKEQENIALTGVTGGTKKNEKNGAVPDTGDREETNLNREDPRAAGDCKKGVAAGEWKKIKTCRKWKIKPNDRNQEKK